MMTRSMSPQALLDYIGLPMQSNLQSLNSSDLELRSAITYNKKTNMANAVCVYHMHILVEHWRFGWSDKLPRQL